MYTNVHIINLYQQDYEQSKGRGDGQIVNSVKPFCGRYCVQNANVIYTSSSQFINVNLNNYVSIYYINVLYK